MSLSAFATPTNNLLQSGPKNFVRKENERVIAGPIKMITILPNHYVKIENPVRMENGKPVFDEYPNKVNFHSHSVVLLFDLQ